MIAMNETVAEILEGRNLSEEVKYDVHYEIKIKSSLCQDSGYVFKMVYDVKKLLDEIRHVYENKLPNSKLGKPEHYKSTNLANNRVVEGNKRYDERNFDDALTLYTKSVALSPTDNSRVLAIAYAHRSATLFEIGEYVCCLLDINRALKGNCPPHMREELQHRKERCLTLVRLSDKSDEIDEDETDLLITSDTDDEDDSWLNSFNLDNLSFSNVSHKIEVKCDDTWGRYFVASEDIEPGEILSIQKLYLCQVYPHKSLKRCFFCLKMCNALIACHLCPLALYCSNRCRKQAYESYHRTECELNSHRHPKQLDKVGLEDWLVVQALLAGTNQGAELESLMEAFRVEDILQMTSLRNPANKSFGNDYMSLLTWSRTFDLSYMSSCVEKSVETVLKLRNLSFFENVGTNDLFKVSSTSPSDQISDAELFTVALLLNHYNVLKTNKVNRFTDSVDRDVRQTRNEYWGGGLSALNNLSVGHSCYPNTYFSRRERYQAMFTGRPIKKGEQVLVSFNTTFDTDSKFERNEILSEFDITCGCEACVNNWPTVYRDLIERGTEYVTNKYKLLVDLFNPQLLKIDRRKDFRESEAIEMIVRVLKLLYKMFRAPSLPILLCENVLVHVVEMLYDDSAGKMWNEKLIEMYGDIICDMKSHQVDIDPITIHTVEKIREMNRVLYREFCQWKKFSK